MSEAKNSFQRIKSVLAVSRRHCTARTTKPALPVRPAVLDNENYIAEEATMALPSMLQIILILIITFISVVIKSIHVQLDQWTESWTEMRSGLVNRSSSLRRLSQSGGDCQGRTGLKTDAFVGKLI